MTEKRFRMETIGDIMLPFIVDNSTAKKKSDTTTTYHTYETHRKEKCLELVDLLNDFSEENEQLKQENSVFEGKDAKHYQRWVKQIKKYVEETNTDFTYDDDFIIKIALSYTLQSLRNGESLKRFQWDYEELGE